MVLPALVALALAASLAACSSGDSTTDARSVDSASFDASDTSSDATTGDGAAAASCEPSAALLARIDASRLKAHLEALVGLGERRSLAGQKAAAAYLHGQLAGLPGLTIEDQSYSYKGADYTNIVVTVRGREHPDELILIGAHYDSTSESATIAPGADDNASGAAALLEITRALAGCQPRRSARVLFLSNEEKGLIGATAYVNELKKTTPPSLVQGYLNVDMIGFGPADEDLDIAARPADAAFAQATADAVEAYTTLKVVQHIDDHCG